MLSDIYLDKIYEIHDVDCNQKYGKELPYSFHLKSVVSIATKYINVPNEDERSIILAAAGHDLIEDARISYNDVRGWLGQTAADIIYACTEEKGKNRSERHSDKFFKELAENRLAVFVKLCDIMANILFSILTNSSMLSKYKKEFPKVKENLYIAGEYDKLWENLEKLLEI